jgi:hypothetical protein
MTSSIFSRLFLGACVMAGATGMLSAQRSDILPPQRRAPIVEQVQTLVNPPPPAELHAELNNPFFPNSLKPEDDFLTAPIPQDTEGPAQVAPASVYELLETIAPQINPTGAITLGGQPLLLFGQKKIRIGDQLPIIFEGERYTLVISRIETSSFTLRLGAAEVTRPIKPNSSP